MLSPAAANSRPKLLLERLHTYVDELFQVVLNSLRDKRPETRHVVEEKLVAVEELRHVIAIETLLFIARWQPLGRDLARAESYIRASYDLFRVARYLREIVVLDEVAGPLYEVGVNTSALAKARSMVDRAIKALLSEDSNIAGDVEAEDREIDEYYKLSIERLSEEVVPRKVAVEALYARHVERIADHATYIARLPTGEYPR